MYDGILAPNAKLRSKVVSQTEAAPGAIVAVIEEGAHADRGRPMRLDRAKLLKRVLDLALGHCPSCAGDLKIIAAMLERPAMAKIGRDASIVGRELSGRESTSPGFIPTMRWKKSALPGKAIAQSRRPAGQSWPVI